MRTDREELADEPGLDEHSSVTAVQRLYDRWARLYDLNPVLALVRPVRSRAVAKMQLDPGDTVVDMGTGTGANLPHLRDAVGADGTVIGIDLSPRMLQRANQRIEANSWENVTVVKGDIREPPLDETVDGILSTFVVVMYADPGPLIETWGTYLDHGSLANVYAGPSDRWYATVVNALLHLYLRLFEEGWVTGEDDVSPLDILTRRGQRAREAMKALAPRTFHDTAVFGLAQLDIGQIP